MSEVTEQTVERVRVAVGDREVEITGFAGEYLFEQIRSTGTFYEADLLDTLVRALEAPAGSLIVDIGANIGNHSLCLLAHFEGASLLAVEPEPANAHLWGENFDKNGLGDRGRVGGFASCSTKTVVGLEQAIPGNGGTYRAQVSDSGVAAVPVDSLVDPVTPVSLVKVDVEGAEEHALLGCLELLERDHPVVVAEAHTAGLFREVEDVLAPFGYRVCGVGGRSDTVIWATGPAADRFEEHRRVLAPRARSRSVQSGLHHAGERAEHARTAADEARAAVDAHGERSRSDHQDLTARLDAGVEGLRRQLGDVARSVAGEHEGTRTRLREVTAPLADRVTTLQERLDGVRAAQERQDHAMREQRRREEARDDGLTELGAHTADTRRLVREQAELARARSERARRVLDRQGHREPSWTDALTGRTRALLDADPLSSGASGVRSAVRRLGTTVTDDTRVRIGIATIPERVDMLTTALRSLTPQADEICVYLNGYSTVPAGLDFGGKVRFHTGPDLGDRAKFLFLEDFDGYYLTCDDDIHYPSYYVEHVIAGIERYGREAVVGWHSSTFLPGFSAYYDKGSREVRTYYARVDRDQPVHLLGTGIAGFHTQTRPLRFEDCRLPNMGDVWLAASCQDKAIPMVLLAHEARQAMPIDRDAPSISLASMGRAPTAAPALDVGAVVTELVRERMPWRTHTASAVSGPPRLRVAVLGRTDRSRWKKGGILKSCHLLADGLRAHGSHVVLQDIETGDPFSLGGASADLVMLYVADPRRPDFARVEQVVEHHARAGRTVLINLSVQGTPEREQYVVDRLRQWEAELPAPVFGMVFTQAALNDRAYEAVRHRLVVIPKTVVALDRPAPRFADTTGVFVGDVAKIADPALVGGDGAAWVQAIRDALPGVPLVGVQQYRPAHPVRFDLDEVWPHLESGAFFDRVRSTRLMVTPVRHATFEMVPVEVAAMGLPVVYRAMPWSLSETLGIAGVQVEEPGDLAEVLPSLYHDPAVWSALSRASRQRARSQATPQANAQMMVQLRRLAGYTDRSARDG